MKKFVILVIIVFSLWNQFYKSSKVTTKNRLEFFNTKPTISTVPDRSLSFICDGRQYCSQMNSRAEAVYFIRHCPNTKMDGDHDGVPCENDSRF